MAMGVTTLESRFVIPRGKAVRNLLSPAASMVVGKKADSSLRNDRVSLQRYRNAVWFRKALAATREASES